MTANPGVQRVRWMEGGGPAADLVLSSRIRLARNLEDYPFPTLLGPEQGQEIISLLEGVIEPLSAAGFGRFTLLRMADLSPLERRVLVEQHLISPQHARNAATGAVILNEDRSVSIMVNEEDHLRIQCLLGGLQLHEAWAIATRVDDVIEAHVRYAFDEERGYLTTCPTNLGTGIRASVMVHLPGLVLARQAGRFLSQLGKVGVVVRGLYGEGTEALGNVFQVSNQITLGPSEEELIDNLIGFTRQLLDQERSTRERLYRENEDGIKDRVMRAYGLLTNAWSMSSEEAIRLLSDLRLGIDLNILSHVRPEVFGELIVLTRPACLQQLAGKELDARERDLRRARLIRERIAASLRKTTQ
ncbi:protein arginine kinase [Thermaerobacter litoralis]